MRWQIPLAVMTAGLTPAVGQIVFMDSSLSQQWVQVLPAPTRGTGGTATVTKKPLNAPINYYQIDLLVNASGSGRASAAAVMINTDASYAPASLGPLGSFLYSESSNHFSGGGQLCGAAVRQSGKIFVFFSCTAPSGSGWSVVQPRTVTASDLAELHVDGTWLNYGSHPDFSATGAKIEFGFWRASDNSNGPGGVAPCMDMYYCPPSGPSSPGPLNTSHGVASWSVNITLQIVSPTVTQTPNTGSSDDPVSTATGEYYELVPQISLGGPLPLYFTRYYGAFLRATGVAGSLGNNWTHNFETALYLNGKEAVVRLFRGQPVRFSQTESGWRLAGAERYPYQLLSAGGAYRFLDASENLIYTYDGNGLLTRIEDRNGNALTVTRSASSPGPDRVSDGLGRSLSFVYTGGKLTRVEDQRGRAIVF